MTWQNLIMEVVNGRKIRVRPVETVSEVDENGYFSSVSRIISLKDSRRKESGRSGQIQAGVGKTLPLV